MAKVSFHRDGAATRVIDAADGTTLMRVAVTEGVEGIVGECGGQAMCATCHVYVREPYLESLPEMTEDEDEMLDCATASRDELRSRLSCQLKVGPELDGIEVDVPTEQV